MPPSSLGATATSRELPLCSLLPGTPATLPAIVVHPQPLFTELLGGRALVTLTLVIPELSLMTGLRLTVIYSNIHLNEAMPELDIVNKRVCISAYIEEVSKSKMAKLRRPK